MSENPGGGTAQVHVDPELRESQLELMHRTDQLILDHANTLAETLQFIVSETQRILGALHVDVLFEYPDGLRVEISSDDAEIGRFVPIDSSISGLVLSRREPLRANDIQADPLLRERYYPRQYMESEGPAPSLSVLVADLTLDGQTIGVINVEGSPDGRFDQSHLNFVTAMARQISVAITHAALFDEDKLRTDTDKLLMAGTGVDSDVVMRDVLEQILSALSSLTFLKPDAADILFADPQDTLTLAVAYSTNSDDIGIRVPIASSVCGEAFRTGSPILIKGEEREYYRPILEDMRCEMAIPIILGGSRNKFPIGVLNLESTRDNAFSTVGKVLAERFSKRVVNAVSMTKIRTDFDSALQDQLMVLAADQVLNAVHRINNYIGSIRAVVTDLQEDLDSPGLVDADDIRHRLRLIRDDIDHALDIPDELRKRISAPEESADVNAQVEAGIQAVRIPKNIRLIKDLAPGLPNLPCTALDLVVENLLLNAMKAIRHPPGELRVSTWLDERPPREPFIVITVQDDGVGMTRKEQDRLFEPRKPGTRGSGLGFGMLWVRGWVRRAQGLIEVVSAPGSGTTVNIRFQIEPDMIDRAPEGGDSA
jgi:signal transduction histidine kinase